MWKEQIKKRNKFSKISVPANVCIAIIKDKMSLFSSKQTIFKLWKEPALFQAEMMWD